MEVVLVLMAIAGGVVDSSLGMMYGTILSPLLIGMGYDPMIVIPSVLLSQALGGSVGTVGHHRLENGNFRGFTSDTKIALAIIVPALCACYGGVYLAIAIPVFYIKLYIGVLVIVMGLLCIRPMNYKFDWRIIGGIGLVSGFNKSFSGGGFGPITSTGKILGGVNPRLAVATTTFAKVPVCLASFFIWLALSGDMDWAFASCLCGGAVIGSLLGPPITSKINTERLKVIIGALAIIAGLWVLAKILL